MSAITLAYWAASLCLWGLISFHVFKAGLPLSYAIIVSIGASSALFLLARAAA